MLWESVCLGHKYCCTFTKRLYTSDRSHHYENDHVHLAFGVRSKSPGRPRHEDTVLNGQRIGGQTLNVPISDGADIHEEGDDVKVLRHWNFPHLRAQV